MEFIKQLIETEDSLEMASLDRIPSHRRVRMFYQIPAGDYWLSIQACAHYYCTPRETLEDLEEYMTMEIALFNAEGNFIPVTDALPGFTELEDYYEGTIYAYAPVELIERLYQTLKGGKTDGFKSLT